MDTQLSGKLALVTGSTIGIGYAIAESLALEGAYVIINGRSQESVDEAISMLKSETKGRVDGFAGDLSTYIASPLSSATTGAALRVDGGVVKSAF